MLCDYYGCDQPVRETDQDISDDGLRFCEKHGAMADEKIQAWMDGDPAPILSWWVKVQGGAKRATRLMMEGKHPRDKSVP